jgi:aldehyde dehydrogenase (NAD+)
MNQIALKVFPALAVGCTMVLKPSEVTPLNALLFAEILDEAGVPAGVFNLVNGPGLDVGEPLISHPEVDLISFTGSTRAGVKISQLASTSIKRVCLELGGKSPFLISENADLETAVKMGVDDVMYNTGQTCTALTRMLIPAKHYNKAIEIAKEHAEKIKVGDPLNEETFMGPMTSKSQLDVVLNYIKIGQEEGARLITGGQKTAGYEKGFYINPTIFADVKNDMRIAREEIFGPVLCMISYSDENEAIRIANDTPYGLSARVWCDDKQHGETLARQINAGQVYINDGLWNDAAPFGGYKQSGNGREFGSLGVEEFFETKSILS